MEIAYVSSNRLNLEIEKPRKRYALLLLIPQFSKKLNIDITAITQ
jgi:hypothetical protein